MLYAVIVCYTFKAKCMNVRIHTCIRCSLYSHYPSFYHFEVYHQSLQRNEGGGILNITSNLNWIWRTQCQICSPNLSFNKCIFENLLIYPGMLFEEFHSCDQIFILPMEEKLPSKLLRCRLKSGVKIRSSYSLNKEDCSHNLNQWNEMTFFLPHLGKDHAPAPLDSLPAQMEL